MSGGAAPVGGHTPGPWEAVKANWDRTLIRHALPGDAHVPGYIAEVNNIGAGYEANARLIAAAPDSHAANVAMVDALNFAFGITSDHDDDYIYDTLPTSGVASAYFAARKAIARATGAAS